MKYWWVNHNKTAKQELEGGYLWSPRREANGARSQFYDNMRLAEPGDVVLSFVGGFIRHVGRVLDFAVPSPKPSEFGLAGINWSSEGWLLPLEWQPLTKPVRPRDRIAELRVLLPEKYSPIHAFSGNGNQKAYLAEVGRAVFETLTGAALIGDSEAANHFAATANTLHRIDDAVQNAVAQSLDLDLTTRQHSILARRGQGLFRERVFELEKSCRLTGVGNPQLLIASHIKPWRMCCTASERLDGANGLLLTPHVDRLFDRGLITFGRNGNVLVSPRLCGSDLELMGLTEACARSCGRFHDRQAVYLEYHRNVVFLS